MSSVVCNRRKCAFNKGGYCAKDHVLLNALGCCLEWFDNNGFTYTVPLYERQRVAEEEKIYEPKCDAGSESNEDCGVSAEAGVSKGNDPGFEEQTAMVGKSTGETIDAVESERTDGDSQCL